MFSDISLESDEAVLRSIEGALSIIRASIACLDPFAFDFYSDFFDSCVTAKARKAKDDAENFASTFMSCCADSKFWGEAKKSLQDFAEGTQQHKASITRLLSLGSSSSVLADLLKACTDFRCVRHQMRPDIHEALAGGLKKQTLVLAAEESAVMLAKLDDSENVTEVIQTYIDLYAVAMKTLPEEAVCWTKQKEELQTYQQPLKARGETKQLETLLEKNIDFEDSWSVMQLPGVLGNWSQNEEKASKSDDANEKTMALSQSCCIQLCVWLGSQETFVGESVNSNFMLLQRFIDVGTAADDVGFFECLHDCQLLSLEWEKLVAFGASNVLDASNQQVSLDLRSQAKKCQDMQAASSRSGEGKDFINTQAMVKAMQDIEELKTSIAQAALEVALANLEDAIEKTGLIRLAGGLPDGGVWKEGLGTTDIDEVLAVAVQNGFLTQSNAQQCDAATENVELSRRDAICAHETFDEKPTDALSTKVKEIVDQAQTTIFEGLILAELADFSSGTKTEYAVGASLSQLKRQIVQPCQGKILAPI